MENRIPSRTEQEYRLETRELMQNADNRVPIVLCIECSYGMKKYLGKVIGAVRDFCENIRKDPIACNCVELCIISYGGKTAKLERRFTLAKNLDVPQLEGDRLTPLADAAKLAMKALEIRRENYALGGIGNQAPLILFIGGGGRAGSLGETAKRLHDMAETGGITIKCVSVGGRNAAGCAPLKELSPDGKVLFLEELKIGKFFDFLSQAVRRSSDSILREEANYRELDQWEDVLS